MEVEERITYELQFSFDTVKDNSSERKQYIQKLLNDYSVNRRLNSKRTIICKKDDTKLTINQKNVRIVSKEKDEIYRLLLVICKVYSYDVQNLKNNACIFFRDMISIENLEPSKYINFISKSVNSNLDNTNDILVEASILTLIDKENIVKCQYTALKDGLYIELLSMIDYSKFDSVFEMLSKYLNEKKQEFIKDVFEK
ncbi:hypothetical protein [Clostridium butyricum]|uniref:hypothetical protein n=1 Tax=Clostridium butyricum TaxID=1492 RepID=UPI0018A930A5|nr:hypothetical protein [Clostridium butyricum]